jgi:hypothetical protein
MKSWLRLTLVTTTVGGGFVGIAITLGELVNAKDASPFIFLSMMAFVGLYAFVTFAGLLYVQNERRTLPLHAAFLLQIFWISSPIIAWRFTAGFEFTVSLIGGLLNAEFWLGSLWQFSIFQELPWGFGVNLYAIFMFFLLLRMRATPVEPLPSIASQVDSILQLRLLNTPLAKRAIRLQALPEGHVMVWVGTQNYASVDEVPELEIRTAIQAAVAEWENRCPS